MKDKQKKLLVIDGVVNLVLGILLLGFPLGVGEFLGAPVPSSNFYPTILGGVIFGIGAALLVERYGAARGLRGLGIGGAIAINFCGAAVLAVWLVSTSLQIPPRGLVILWLIVIIVFGIGLAEVFTGAWKD